MTVRPNLATCAGCGAAIAFVKLHGKPHPVEVTDKIIIVDGKIVRGPESHFANCPKAGQFRNRGAAAETDER